MEWFAFYPAGTLLFKGAEPMEMGADHHASLIFPPPAHTIAGALRTAVLFQNGVSFENYYKKKVEPTIISAIGDAGSPAPFQVCGPLFRIGEELFVPAPYSWFTTKDNLRSHKIKIFQARSIKSSLIRSENENLLWVKGESADMVSIGGKWIQIKSLSAAQEQLEIFAADHFYDLEPRTGIALNRNRIVKEGHLYTFTHIRLKPKVSLVFGVSIHLPMADKGVLKLGAEQRFGRYKKIDEPLFFHNKTENISDQFMALNPVSGSKTANQSIIATGKIQYIGGWDLKKGFHKPMQGFFPAGSVFSEKLESHFLQL